MRDILEELPHALLPDPTRESDDPGIPRDLHDDDLVRPVAEDDHSDDAGRSRKSPLAKHVEVPITPFDPRLSTPISVLLAVEGLRVRSATLDIGHTHQGLERQAFSLAVDGVALSAVLSAMEPPLLAQMAVALAVERVAGVEVDATTRQWRELACDIVSIGEHARVLRDTLRRAPRLATHLAAVAKAADAAVDGIAVGHRLSFPGGLRSPIPEHERETLARRLGEVARAIRGVNVKDVIDAVAHLRGAGVVDLARCRELGVDGPTLAAAGGTSTLPADLGLGANLMPHGDSGCALSRVEVRLDGMTRGSNRAQRRLQELDEHAKGNVDAGANAAVDSDRVAVDVATLNGAADALVRGPSGTLSCMLWVEAGRVRRLRLRPPDVPLVSAVSRALRGTRLDDVSDVFASFGLRASAVDR
jgi:Ni,Fe-hydrogenase III large subunit